MPTQLSLKTPQQASNFERGARAEALAVQYLEKSNAEILYRNCRLPYGEVDIVAIRNEQIYLVEVKTVSKQTELKTRITARQKRSLRYNRIWLEEEFKMPTKILWAFVKAENIIWMRDEGD